MIQCYSDCWTVKCGDVLVCILQWDAKSYTIRYLRFVEKQIVDNFNQTIDPVNNRCFSTVIKGKYMLLVLLQLISSKFNNFLTFFFNMNCHCI